MKKNIVIKARSPGSAYDFADSALGFCIEVFNKSGDTIRISEMGFMDRAQNILFTSTSFFTSNKDNEISPLGTLEGYFHTECQHLELVSLAYVKLNCGELIVAKSPELYSLSES